MSAIILPAGVIACIGLIAGIILTVASKLMFVPVDEQVAAIREELPGANCGACGFAGCDDYAAAFSANPDTSVTACPVGGADLAERIAMILGVEAGSVEPKAAMVMCAGDCFATTRLMTDARISSCKGAAMFYGGDKSCPFGCLGFGDCAAVCDYGAISWVDGIAKIDKDVCVGCAMCVKACPKNLIQIVEKKKFVHVLCMSKDKGAATKKACDNGCIGCKKCVKACKFDAIEVENNFATIIYDKCKDCGLCAKECPTGAIVNMRPQKPKKELTPEQLAKIEAAKAAKAAKAKEAAEAAKPKEASEAPDTKESAEMRGGEGA